MTDTALPYEESNVVWRICGSLGSPRSGRSTFDFIEQILDDHVPSSSHKHQSISVIRGWFDRVGDQIFVKEEVREQTAVLVLDGIAADRSERAIWAIGLIDRDLSVSMIRARWSVQEIEAFIDAVLTTLEHACKLNHLINVSNRLPVANRGSARATVPRESLWREGTLETFQHLRSHRLDLIHTALHRPTANLIEVVLDLQPNRFESLIERLDHPVVQARAALYILASNRKKNHSFSLRWISKDSCDALIALGIMHTLETAHRLEVDISTFNRSGQEYHSIWSTELDPSQDDLETAIANLLDGLVAPLAELEPRAGIRWLSELLSRGTYTLFNNGEEKSPLIERLETMCAEKIALLIRESTTDEIIEGLFAGLRCSQQQTYWMRHLANVAWSLHDTDPERATILAHTTLEEFEGWLSIESNDSYLHVNWSDWCYREWINGLGLILALSIQENNLLDWITSRCQSLPLSVWNAEETRQNFNTASRIARTWFLVAFHSITHLIELGCIKHVDVLALAETAWAHCFFSRQYSHERFDESVLDEYAARIVIEYGKPTDQWLLNQARDRTLSPRTLWGLMDQWKKRVDQKKRSQAGDDDEFVIDEFTRVASIRFGTDVRFEFEPLQYWGRLWLLLGAKKEAQLTAESLLEFPNRIHTRQSKILVLELLCFGDELRTMNQQIWEYVESTYREVWPSSSYTPDLEREVRNRIDTLLGNSSRKVL